MKVVSHASDFSHVALALATIVAGLFSKSFQMGTQLVKHATSFAVMFNLDGKIIYCNGHFIRLTGLSLDDVLGRTWNAVFVSPRAADSPIPHPDWSQSKANVTIHESDLLTRAGECYRVRWNSTPLRDTSGTMVGVASIGEDLNEKRRLEGELLDSMPASVETWKENCMTDWGRTSRSDGEA